MRGVELAAVFVPLRDDDHGVRTAKGLVAVFDVVELGVHARGVLERCGVGDGDAARRGPRRRTATSSAGESRMSSLCGLNAAPSTVMFFSNTLPSNASTTSCDGAFAAAEVDRVDLAQEGDGLAAAEFFGAGRERADVLRQAAAAEADAGAEEAAADAGVVADRVGELRDVGAGDLGDLGHRVDERDLRREERVGGDLDELGGRVVGDDERRLLRDGRVVDLAQDAGRPLALFAVGHARDEPVGVDRVFDRPALAEELRVPDERRAGRRDPLGEIRGGADRHRRLARDDVAGAQVGESPSTAALT